MFIKIQTPDGNWDIREANSIQYSDSPYPLHPTEKKGQLNSYYWSPFIPLGMQKLFDSLDVDREVDIINFNRHVYWDDGEWREFPNNTEVSSCFVNYLPQPSPIDNEKLPSGWYGVPMYSYAILDKKKAVIFPTKAYILNDDGKTIAKIG